MTTSYTPTEQLAHTKELCSTLETTHLPQTIGRLRTTEGYCCLGVACTLVPNVEWTATSIGYRAWLGETLMSTSLRGDVQTYYGLTHNEQNQLMQCNDQLRMTFKQIAGVIRMFILPRLEKAARA